MLAVLTHKLVPLANTVPAESEAGVFALITAFARSIRRRHQRNLEEQMGTFVENHGGRLTDDIERQIARQF